MSTYKGHNQRVPLRTSSSSSATLLAALSVYAHAASSWDRLAAAVPATDASSEVRCNRSAALSASMPGAPTYTPSYSIASLHSHCSDIQPCQHDCCALALRSPNEHVHLHARWQGQWSRVTSRAATAHQCRKAQQRTRSMLHMLCFLFPAETLPCHNVRSPAS